MSLCHVNPYSRSLEQVCTPEHVPPSTGNTRPTDGPFLSGGPVLDVPDPWPVHPYPDGITFAPFAPVRVEDELALTVPPSRTVEALRVIEDVPEPATLVLFALGAAGLARRLRR